MRLLWFSSMAQSQRSLTIYPLPVLALSSQGEGTHSPSQVLQLTKKGFIPLYHAILILLLRVKGTFLCIRCITSTSVRLLWFNSIAQSQKSHHISSLPLSTFQSQRGHTFPNLLRRDLFRCTTQYWYCYLKGKVIDLNKVWLLRKMSLLWIY